MRNKILVAEIGSTTTIISAFEGLNTSSPIFIGQGQSSTTVLEGDVTIGLKKALENLKFKYKNVDFNIYDKMYATSSAAGGLKMTVHGLVYDMTVKASKEAALGAGANIKMITAGKIRRTDKTKISDINPNIILIAGGVDYGERDTTIFNAEQIASMNLDTPVIYAGNIENIEEIKLIFKEVNKEHLLYIVDNVYPKIDTLNVEPTRKVIQKVFEKHITKAPGMEKIKNLVNGRIIPVPGAVMKSSKLLEEIIGNLVVFDIGGATSDVHSVADDTDTNALSIMQPEPRAKRTVEGDLGLYINKDNILELLDEQSIINELNINIDEFKLLIKNYKPIPETENEKNLVSILLKTAIVTSINRHMGKYKDVYTSKGKESIAYGKDLSMVKNIIGTGGALVNLSKGRHILENISDFYLHNTLHPPSNVNVFIDSQYIMSTIGVLCDDFIESSKILLEQSLI